MMHAPLKANTVRELIDQMAEAQGDQTFLISPETASKLTYKKLQERALSLSARFAHMGLRCGDKIAFLMDNGLFTAQLFLGSMYGGFVAVPLNVRAGLSQLSHMLDDSDAPVVFVGREYSALIKEVMTSIRRPLEVIFADINSGVEGALKSSIEVPPPVGGEDPALLMYSSGSTGLPKGAIHTHRSVLAHGQNSAKAHQLTAADRSLLVLPLYHINAECVTLVPTLTAGGSVVIPHGFLVSEFWNWLDDYQCTWSALVPTIISQLLNWDDPNADSRATAFRRIRFLRTSSAPLSPALHREFIDKFKLVLIQAMGSSEAGNVFSNPLPPEKNKIGSPGLPWGFEAKIIDRRGDVVTPGQPGEVLLRGAGQMQGYHKDQAGTAAAVDADGWLHTGDLAYQDEDGYFFVVGRSKELIIKGGMNIAPKQIDEALESHGAILEAAAVGVPNRYLGEDVVAFAVLRSGMNCDELELLSFCEKQLGAFKTPSRIFLVKDLPKGPSGKVQRLRLTEEAERLIGERPANARIVSATSADHARGPWSSADLSIERIIAEIWSELLAQPILDPNSNFFALGGQSLLAIQVLSTLREKLPVVLSLSDFFENPTIARQATLVRKRLGFDNFSSLESTVAWEQELLQRVGAATTEEAISPRDRSLSCPLSPNQQRIWFMERLISGVPLFNESEAARLKGELDADLLERCLNVIIARHEILRTTIQTSGEEPAAVVHESWPLRLKLIDLGPLAPAQRETEVQRLLIDEVRLPYDLTAEPGIRVTLLRLSEAEHVLILMMHHLVCDWASEGALWRELSVLYRAGRTGQRFELPALPIQHGDYAVWAQSRLSRKETVEDLAYWEEKLRGAPALVDLATGKPRPRTISYRGARQRFQIPPALTLCVQDFGRRQEVSLFTLFAAALNVLLYRYTGQEDISVGIPLADRDRPEVQSVIGFLLHVHVLRTQLSADLSFRELLARVQNGTLDLYAHRSPPFDQVVSRVQPLRNASYSPLFQVMLNWRDRNQQLAFIGLHGLEVQSLLAESRTSKFDLTMIITDGANSIDLEMEYNTDLFDKTGIERMFGHFCTVLEGAVANLDQPVANLPLLTGCEFQRIVVDWNQTRRDLTRSLCVHQLVEEQVERTPEAVAAEFGDQIISYRELNSLANQHARLLRSMGINANARVAICMERSLELLVAVLAVLKAGAAYVPLDPANPAERVAFVLKDAESQLLLSQGAVAKRLPSIGTKIICLDETRERISHQSTENLETITNSDDLAYVIYTSGSTGQPKGVAMGHKPLVNLLEWQCARPEVPARCRTLQFAPLSFDVSFQEIFSTWRSGGTLVLVTEEVRRDSVALLHFLSERSVERLFLPFVALHHLAETVCREGLPPIRLCEIITAGEQLRITPQIRSLFEQLNGCTLQNQYGPTESHVVTSFSLTGPPAAWEELPPIGRPIANAEILILNPAMQPVPIGVTGELYIGGQALAKFYLNRRELTAERFIERPVHLSLGRRWYKTGDLARYLSDGNIEFRGRSDFQVKVRGFRVELGEVEAVLATHSAIGEVAAAVHESQPGEKRLVAYVVLNGEKKVPVDDLRSFLSSKLPEYMVPSVFVYVDTLPLSPNGKVDRHRLPVPGSERPELGTNHVAPSNPIERIVADIWAKSLGLDKVGVHDNFFDLGGHSLLMAQIQTKLRDTLTKNVSLVEMFQYPTVSLLAQHISAPSDPSTLLQEAKQRARRQRYAFSRQA